MTCEPSTKRRDRVSELLAAAVLALVIPLGVYWLAALAAARADRQPAGEVVCFDPGRFDLPQVDPMSIQRMGLSLAMTVGAVAFLFVVPGLLGMLAFRRRPTTRPTPHLWSLAVNTAALMLICLILRHTTVGIDRISLSVAWWGWSLVLFTLAWEPARSVGDGGTVEALNDLWQRYGGAMLVALLTALLAIVTLFPEQGLQCISDDGAEAYQLARSLHGHLLPYFELEAETGDRLGTAVGNPSLLNSYWTFALQVLLGGKELPGRLPYWVWWMGIFAVSYRMVRPQQRADRWIAAAVLGLLAFLSSLLYTFYAGYYPYMADLAAPGVNDAMFTLTLLLAFDCLRQRDNRGFVVSIALASLLLYAGPVFLLAILAAAWIWQPIGRRELVRWGLQGVGVVAAIAAFYLVWGALERSLSAWMEIIGSDYVDDYLAPLPRWKSAPVFFGYFLLGCGGIPAWGLVVAFRPRKEDCKENAGRWQRTMATATLLYLLVVLSSGFKNLHYLGPLLPIPMILFLLAGGDARKTTDAERAGKGRRAIAGLLAVGSLIVCIAACWPKQRQTFTLNRQLGARTTILAESEMTAYRWARLHHVLYDQGKVSWQFGPHCWATCAEWDPKPVRLRPFVLTDGGPPSPAHLLVASEPIEGTDRTAKLYAQNTQWIDWLSAQRALPPPERYPMIMRPLAAGPFSPRYDRTE